MADTSGIRSGRAYVEIGANDSEMRRVLAQSQVFFQSWGRAITASGLRIAGLGAGLAAPFIAASAAFSTMGSDLALASLRTGIAVEQLSQLKYAAGQAGVDFEGLQAAIQRMNRNLSGLSNSTVATKALKDINLPMQQLRGLKPDEQFKKISDAIAGVESPTLRAAAAMALFGGHGGTTGAQLLPLILQGSAGIGKLMDQANALGLTMSTTDAFAALQFKQRLSDLWAVVSMGSFRLGGELAPSLTVVINLFLRANKIVTDFAAAHQKAFQYIVAGTAAFAIATVVAGAALVTFGAVMSGVGAAMGAVTSTISFFTTAISLAGSALSLAFLTVPGLAVTAIVGLAAAVIYFSGVAGETGHFVVSVFGDIWDSIKFVFNNTSSISQAWGAIVAEAAMYAQEAWTFAKGEIVSLWISIKGFASQTWNEVGSLIVRAAYTTAEAYLNIWATTMHAWASLVNKTVDFILDNTQQRFLDSALKAIDASQKAGKITPQQADQQRQAAHRTFDNYQSNQGDIATKANDDKLDETLAKVKKEYDEKKAALDKLTADQAVSIAQQTADERAENDKQIADAKRTADEKRKAYEQAMKDRLAASGQSSIADQVTDAGKAIFKPLSPDSANGYEQALKGSSSGTFNTSALFGFGGGSELSQIASNTKRAADQTAEVVASVNKLYSKFGITTPVLQ